MQNRRGGARKNSGPKTGYAGVKMRSITLTLDDRTIEKLRVVGGGNASKGARIGADLAYEDYQNQPG